MTAMGQVLRKQLPVRRRNDRIVPAGKNEHGGFDAWQKHLQTRKVTRVGLDERGGLRKPAAGGGQPVILENRVRRRDSRVFGDRLHSDIATLQSIESPSRRCDEVLEPTGRQFWARRAAADYENSRTGPVCGRPRITTPASRHRGRLRACVRSQGALRALRRNRPSPRAPSHRAGFRIGRSPADRPRSAGQAPRSWVGHPGRRRCSPATGWSGGSGCLRLVRRARDESPGHRPVWWRYGRYREGSRSWEAPGGWRYPARVLLQSSCSERAARDRQTAPDTERARHVPSPDTGSIGRS